MREDQFLQSLHFNCLQNEGSPVSQSVPIVLPTTTMDMERLKDASAISLLHYNECCAILRKPEFFFARKEERVARQFGTTNKDHPYIKMIYESGDWLVGGKYSLHCYFIL